ncbi:MAG: ATP-binding region, ATPase domain protein [Marmoricola sp.]|nr:ATP-binding region, ATPase domain protein [Marmoricola sp.]
MNLLDRITASVRIRVTLVAALFVLLVTAVGSIVVVAVIGHTVDYTLIDSARQDAAAIDAQLARGVTPAAAATTGRNDVVVQLLNASGVVIASDRPDELTVPLRTTPGENNTQDIPGGHETYTIVAQASKANRNVRLIIVGRSTELRDDTRAETARTLAVSVPLVVLALAMIVWLSVGRALRPVEVMREEADQIHAAHLARRLAVPAGSDEIPRLARTLNEMLDRIDESQRSQRQFVSDASHELRSPLAVLRQSAELGLAHPELVSQESLADDVLHETARLEDLVSALLLLARVESHTAGPIEPVDVDDVVLVEVARIRDTGTAVHIDVSALSAGRTTGSTVLLGQVVRNLLDNAVRHATGRIEVGLHQHGHVMVLRVDDDGSGIAARDRESVFERFVRLDEGRARDEGGSGLGLAIVRTIVTSLGGTVRVVDAPLGGARFEVMLPTTPDE